MTAYCTPSDVRNALTPDGSAEDASTAANMTDEKINGQIVEATGTVRTRVASRYVIPTTTLEVANPDDPDETWVYQIAAEPVRSWTRNIAAYLSALSFRRNKDLSEFDPIYLRYIATMSTLDKVLKGDIDLDLPVVGGGSSDGVVVVNQYEGDLFSMDDFGLGYSGKHLQRFEVMGGNY